jgi:hypothetical protein
MTYQAERGSAFALTIRYSQTGPNAKGVGIVRTRGGRSDWEKWFIDNFILTLAEFLKENHYVEET